MFVPIGDRYNPEGFTPWVNYGLIAVNVAVFVLITLPLSGQPANPNDPLALAYLDAVRDGVSNPSVFLGQLSAYDLFVYEHGFKPGAPALGDLFSSMFLHGGFMHLAGNMLFLWIYGDNVEYRLGRVTYLLVYLATGVVATVTFAVFAAGSLTPLVGASGAISGVLGLYFIFFPRNEVRVFVALFPFFFESFWIRARWVLGFYVVVDNILPFVVGTSSNVAYGAHLGGFFAGLGVAWLVEMSGSGQPNLEASRAAFSGPSPGPTLGGAAASPAGGAQGPSLDADLAALGRALEMGDLAGATRRARSLEPARVASLGPSQLYHLARALAASGHDALAGRLLRRGLGLHRGEQSQATLHLALGELRLAQGQPAAAYQHLLTGLELAPSGSPNHERARRALSALDARRDEMSRRN